jgi:lipoprotein NlpD
VNAARVGVLAARLAMCVVAGCAGQQFDVPVVDKPVRDEPASGVLTVRSSSATNAQANSKPVAATASMAPTGATTETRPKDANIEAARKGAAAKRETAEADWRPETYTVKKGDTLYGIALDHGLDYRELDAWNGLDDPNIIRVGQELRLRPPPGWKQPQEGGGETVLARPAAAAPAFDVKALDGPVPVKAAPKGVKLAYSERALAQLRGQVPKTGASEPTTVDAARAQDMHPARGDAIMPAPDSASSVSAKAPAAPAGETKSAAASAMGDQGITWVWPARGKLLHPFSEGPNPKGVAIGGQPGQAVVASAAGKVVYSGSGLRGYGKLIIIKHSDTYLSVYAHNRQLLVKEGERVARGQKIAEMGDSDSDRIALHFEIRRLGKPVDPLKYLPEEGTS